jgi:hypothetical protein
MDHGELEARESIRDLVARYNANGDAGRFPQVMELFAPDAVMDIGDGRVYTGAEEILTIFTGVRDRVGSVEPLHLRHFTATHQIDVLDAATATGRCYFQVFTASGLDHWGRYLDGYRVVDGRWRFARRRVAVDGRSPGSRFGKGP